MNKRTATGKCPRIPAPLVTQARLAPDEGFGHHDLHLALALAQGPLRAG